MNKEELIEGPAQEEQPIEYQQQEQLLEEPPKRRRPSLTEYNDIVRQACGVRRGGLLEYNEIVRQACGVRRRKQV